MEHVHFDLQKGNIDLVIPIEEPIPVPIEVPKIIDVVIPIEEPIPVPIEVQKIIDAVIPIE